MSEPRKTGKEWAQQAAPLRVQIRDHEHPLPNYAQAKKERAQRIVDRRHNKLERRSAAWLRSKLFHARRSAEVQSQDPHTLRHHVWRPRILDAFACAVHWGAGPAGQYHVV